MLADRVVAGDRPGGVGRAAESDARNEEVRRPEADLALADIVERGAACQDWGMGIHLIGFGQVPVAGGSAHEHGEAAGAAVQAHRSHLPLAGRRPSGVGCLDVEVGGRGAVQEVARPASQAEVSPLACVAVEPEAERPAIEGLRPPLARHGGEQQQEDSKLTKQRAPRRRDQTAQCCLPPCATVSAR